MNLSKKYAIRERRLLYMQELVDSLNAENEALRSENQDLLNKINSYNDRIASADAARENFISCIEDLNVIKEQYEQALHDIQQMKKKYSKEFKESLGVLVRHVR